MTAMNGTAMNGLCESVALARPTDYPRANDLLTIGLDLAETVGFLLPRLWVLRRAAMPGRIREQGETADALFHLAAWAGAVEAQVEQYHQIRADLSGEGYAMLNERGEGLPYFSDADYGDDGNQNGEGVE